MPKLKSFGGLFAVLLVVSISLLLVSVVFAKPVGKNPGTAWVPGTVWGTKLRLENGNSVWDTYFGVGASEMKLGSPPDPPSTLVVEFFDDNNWYEWVKAAAAHENYPIRMRSVGAAPSSGTLSSVMENSDTLFVPQDFSVVLENTTLGLNVNLRKENKLITGLPVLATLYLDNAVNVTISPGSQTGDPGDNVGFTVTFNNTGRYDDTYLLRVDADNLTLYTISPSSLRINAGSSATATLTVTVGTNNQVITVTADGNYADDNASCMVITTAYTLTTSVDPLNIGSVTLDPARVTYPSGTDVTVTANPASGYEFDHWSSDTATIPNPTDNSITIRMNSNESIIAHFKSTSGGASGGLPWTWIVVGIIIVVVIVVAVVATTGRRRVHVLAR